MPMRQHTKTILSWWLAERDNEEIKGIYLAEMGVIGICV